MMKFTCGHCGGRIAIAPKLMGKLVVCPDCGRPTHPLAGDILAAAKSGEPAARSASAPPIDRTCENCGRSIGRLETVELWKNHVVCVNCHAQLAPPPEPKEPELDPSPQGDRSVKALPAPAEQAIVDVPPADRADSGAKTLVLSRILPSRKRPGQAVKVNVARSSDDPNASPSPLRGVSLPMKYRLAALAMAALLSGVLLYGFLALIRDFMTVLTTIAVVLIAAAIGLVAVRLGVGYLKKWWATRGIKPNDLEASSAAELPPPASD